MCVFLYTLNFVLFICFVYVLSYYYGCYYFWLLRIQYPVIMVNKTQYYMENINVEQTQLKQKVYMEMCPNTLPPVTQCLSIEHLVVDLGMNETAGL